MPSISTVLFTALAVFFASTPQVAAQDVTYDATHNATSLYGTWSSGSGAVRTGVGFANPVNFTFEYPATTGISYSFTVDHLSDGSDGYFEEAQYRFESNATRPTCITGIVQWQHGTYTLNSNGSITLNPFAPDGRQQVQAMCASQSNIIQQFNQTTLFAGWNIVSTTSRGYQLQLLRFDGALLSPMYLVSETPNMLPTEVLTGNITVGQVINSGLSWRTDFSAASVLAATGLAVVMGLVAMI